MQIRLIVGLLLSILCANAIGAQESPLTWQPTLDGFQATYNHGVAKLFVEHQGTGTGTTISRIKDGKNNVLAESIRTSGTMTLTVSNIVVTLTLDVRTPELSTASKLTEEDEATLTSFRRSSSAASIRRVIAELVKSAISRGNLHSFAAIGELIGSEPKSKSEIVDKESRQVAKSQQSRFQFLLASSPVDLSKSVRGTSKKSDCGIRPTGVGTCYCCGAGCSCICYLEACVNHDVCVENDGYLHPRCMALLAVAVAAMADAGPVCGLPMSE